MLKKMVVWGIYSVFLGLLLAGAMYRTSVKLEDGEQSQNRGSGSLQENSERAAIQPENNSVSVNETTDEHAKETLETSLIAGQVLNVSDRGVTILLTNGLTVTVTGRAWRYAQTIGLNTQNGATLWIEGYNKDDQFEIMRLINLEANQNVLLRDQTGHPLWNGD